MTVRLRSFPILTKEMKTKIGFSSTPFQFSYESNGIVRYLSSDYDNDSSGMGNISVTRINDPSGDWHPEDYELSMSKSITISVPKFLFGVSGIAPLSGTVGIAFMWTARDASVRGAAEVGEFGFGNIPFRTEASMTLPAHTLRGSVNVSTVLFLKSAGQPKKSEGHLAGITGTILGILDETKLIIDGNGSLFPVMLVEKANAPLWWVEYSSDEPLTDRFDEDHFCLFLNKSNPAYPELNKPEGIQNSPLFLEIISSAIQILIARVLEEDETGDTLRGENMDPESVSAVVHYLISSYELADEIKAPDELAKKIRTVFAERVKQ